MYRPVKRPLVPVNRRRRVCYPACNLLILLTATLPPLFPIVSVKTGRAERSPPDASQER